MPLTTEIKKAKRFGLEFADLGTRELFVIDIEKCDIDRSTPVFMKINFNTCMRMKSRQ